MRAPLCAVGLMLAPAAAAPGQRSAAKWFLTEAELMQTTKGFNRTATGMHLYSLGNYAEPRVDGAGYMASLHADFQQTAGAGDFAHGTSWNAEVDELLVPDVSDPAASNASAVLAEFKAMVARGVDARILENRNTFYLKNVIEFSVKMNKLKEDTVLTDARFPEWGSHHQKTFVVKRKGETVAYVGGVDLMNSRWNTQKHDTSDPRRQLEPNPPIYPSWHDAMVQLRGPAALDVERNFFQRWNDKADPQFFEKPPKPYAWLNPPVASGGPQAVQLLRTYSCAYGKAGRGYADYAPRGEMSIKAAYLKAISLAQKYIYIEDQYVVDLDIAAAIGDALPRIQFVGITTQTIPEGELPSLINVPYSAVLGTYHRYQFLFNETMTKKHPEHAHKIHWFNLTQPGHPSGGKEYIYVHAKQMMVDDQFAIVGSANLCRRSMTHDSQVSAAITDDSGEFATKLRRNLFGEHLMISPDTPALADAVSGMQLMLKSADTAQQRLRHHTLPDPGPLDEILQAIYDNFVDPVGDCDKDLSSAHVR
eukprot:TRINITY_DN10014_c0_g1_i1.p1 TRINITY_DN10014_c0_g1~~TRINITY_DN10014_c0_g1_i1.p1  ORF type:complete len:534 (+),score=209.86 TRINITY_DN10014_c0_g1_i1:88-1689(+)